MARSMLSLGMFSARAAITAARRRGFMAGSGSPCLAETVISRASLENNFERTASWRPLRCIMFLNCECPAMTRFSAGGDTRLTTVASAGRPISMMRPPYRLLHRPNPGPVASHPEGRPCFFQPPSEPHRADPPRQPGCVVGLDRDCTQRSRAGRWLELGRGDAPQKPPKRLMFGHPDDGVIVAGHSYVGDEGGAAGENLVIGRRR